MKSKLIIVLFLVLISIPLGGCRSFSEIEGRYIVLGAAIDYDLDKNEYSITAEVVNVEDSSIGSVVSKLYTGSGQSMFDALRNIIKISGKKLFWSHTKALIVSKELAGRGTFPILDWVIRDHELRSDMIFVISREKTAREILECKSTKTSIPSNLIGQILENYKSTPKYLQVALKDFALDFETPGIEPIAPAIGIVETDGNRKLQMEGIAVFLSDRLIGFLNDSESMDLLIVRNKLTGGIVNLDEEITNMDTKLVFEIFKNSTKIEPMVEDGKVTVGIIAKPKLGLANTEAPLDLSDTALIEKLKKAYNSYWEKRITNTIKTVQDKYKSDIFGFGHKINISNPSKWKDLKEDWNNNFSSLKFSVKVDAEISGSGEIYKPLEGE